MWILISNFVYMPIIVQIDFKWLYKKFILIKYINKTFYFFFFMFYHILNKIVKRKKQGSSRWIYKYIPRKKIKKNKKCYQKMRFLDSTYLFFQYYLSIYPKLFIPNCTIVVCESIFWNLFVWISIIAIFLANILRISRGTVNFRLDRKYDETIPCYIWNFPSISMRTRLTS